MVNQVLVLALLRKWSATTGRHHICYDAAQQEDIGHFRLTRTKFLMSAEEALVRRSCTMLARLGTYHSIDPSCKARLLQGPALK